MTARVGLTCGDPAGAGLELVLGALSALGDCDARFRLWAAPGHLNAAARASGVDPKGLPLELVELSGPEFAPVPGHYDPAWGRVARQSLEQTAVAATSGEIGGVVTAPISKRIVSAETGIDAFPGQTELYATRANVSEFAMMLACESPRLRVVPHTIHLPLSQVSREISAPGVSKTLRVVDDALRRDFGVSAPRIAVLGLNPHAGESGALGNEEILHIAPAISMARKAGIDAHGPFPADTFFSLPLNWDAVVGMYHDQVLAPFKLLCFDHGVNVTLGLPFVRTSPDHGTAYDLAGTGKARIHSTLAAIRMAVDLVKRR